MFKLKVLNNDVLKEILKMEDVLKMIEKVYVLKAEGKTELFPMVFHEFNPGVADMDIKSGVLNDVDIFGLKLVSWFGENKNKDLPLLVGTTLLFDSNTGAPLAILNAEHITGMRTGAAGAIGAKYLARKNSSSLLMVGTGHIAQFEIAATLIAMESIDTVRIYDPMHNEKSVEYVKSIEAVLRENFAITRKITFLPVTSLENAVSKSDIIITATPSKEAMIKKEWVKKGTHFSCVGSDMEGKQEIDENIFKDAILVVDDISQAINVGETEMPIKKGIIKKEDVMVEIGDIILGSKKGRTSENDITIFDTTGIAIQDLITSKLALDIAKERNLGITIDL
ncbi:ornithine cyclodeaminase family protein [Helicovermis profundi]|uniref:Alanine dehydrogenase n=1 Tax=Helicovermis profundi TaxID=3065157 RepID=A0AAU9E851_9FIRM|nr:alanine dehydrogenase [Clostridia bacterium S502]